MPVILKYTKAQYDAKITELQGYLNELKDHREKMVGLREQMYNFWDDPNARKAGEALNIQIRQGKNLPACRCLPRVRTAVRESYA